MVDWQPIEIIAVIGLLLTFVAVGASIHAVPDELKRRALGAIFAVVVLIAIPWFLISRLTNRADRSTAKPVATPPSEPALRGRVKVLQEERLKAREEAERQARDEVIRVEGEKRKLPEEADRRTREQVANAQDEKGKTREETDLFARTHATSRADQQRRASYLSATHLPSKVEFLVCAETKTRSPMGTFTTALTEHLNARGKAASGFVFSPEFVTSGAFDLFFVGRGGTDLQDMPVSSMGNKLFLVRVNNSVKPGTTVGGLFTASVVVTFSVLSSNDGSAVDGFELRTVGAGTSDTDAVSQALERILDLLSGRGY
jgi:hypothetical protein